MKDPETYAILRLPEVLRLRGRGKTAHYADIEDGLFTRPTGDQIERSN